MLECRDCENWIVPCMKCESPEVGRCDLVGRYFAADSICQIKQTEKENEDVTFKTS